MPLPPNCPKDSEPPVPPNQEQTSLSIMGREANINAIKALEKQIKEGKGDIIELKRTRNSLLNISRSVAPEILGYIFAWSLVREADHAGYSRPCFSGLRKGSYNFLLVCHHWFEVASRTPELWSFWGNDLRDWEKRYRRSGTAPLDLVLKGRQCLLGQFFGRSLQDAVVDRVKRDAIRQIHLSSRDGITLSSILSSLTPDDEGGQNENIESIILDSSGSPPVDASKFFVRSRLSKLGLLDLSGDYKISSWDWLTSRITLLTVLSLTPDEPSPSTLPTTSQLLSILASNPNLRQLTLSNMVLPSDDDGPEFQVPMRDLSLLSLMGNCQRIFSLLRRLILPEKLNNLSLIGIDCTVEDISRLFEPYMRKYFQRDVRFLDRLRISSSPSFEEVSISVHAVCIDTITPTRKPPCVELGVIINDPLPGQLDKFFIDLVALTPKEHVVSFYADLALGTGPLEELFLMMPKIETLCLSDVEVSKGFLQPNPDEPHANAKVLPSLRFLRLERVLLNNEDWGHLMKYLAHQTSNDQTISLVLYDPPDMSLEVASEIRGLVEEFTYEQFLEVEDLVESPSSCGCSTHEEDNIGQLDDN